ncbi:MAG: glutathione-dependent formaldehyde dehydrogenase [Chloroflexi bacterium]|nr:glutathione-dependent formaldehyde dehydrogenase [Chloroflexota bacterium]
MKAVCWIGTHKVQVEQVPDPKIINPRDAIVKITSSAICGSDLHLFDGYIPTLQVGNILGHEFMGEIVEVGPQVTNLRIGDRVVVPFPIACGRCFFCQRGMYALCDNSNPNALLAETMFGQSPAGIYGYSHLVGGYAGGQAEYARVPFADIGPLKIENGLTDEQVLFLSDIFPTGYMAAENCNIQSGDTIAVFGCGPVGQFAIKSAWMLGASRVIAIDRVPERLKMAQAEGKAETINYEEQKDIVEALKDMTGGLGSDACIDAVGMEAHGYGAVYWYDRAMNATRMETDRPTALRLAIQAVRKGGIVSVPGAYGGFDNMFPMGAVFNKGLTLKAGQTHVQKYMKPLLDRIQRGEIDPAFVVTHRVGLDDTPEAYNLFKHKKDGCIKTVIKP